MIRTSYSLYGLACVAVFLCGVIIFLSGSLWFFRWLLPENNGQYVGYYSRFLESNSVIKDIHGKYAHIFPEGIGNFNRFVYKVDDHSEYIVGIPKLTHQFSLAQDLQAHSFTVRRMGLILLARREGEATSDSQNQPFSSFFSAIRKTFVSVVIHRLPIHAQLILKIDTSNNTSNALYVVKNRGFLHLVNHMQSPDFISGKAERSQKSSTEPDATRITITRDMLAGIPAGFVADIESKVSELLRFTKTRPRVLQSLLHESDPIILSIKEHSVAIGIQSASNTTASLIHAWMSNEQGTRHPQKKAFALPDKTIGYEFIPGTSNSRFLLTGGIGNCLPSEEYDETLFLCGSGNVLVIASDEQIGNQLVAWLVDTGVPQSGILYGEGLQAIGLASQFEKIEYMRNEDIFEVWADAK